MTADDSWCQLLTADFDFCWLIICYHVLTDEFGFIKFGSRVDLFFPIGTKINVKINQKVSGGESIIATY